MRKTAEILTTEVGSTFTKLTCYVEQGGALVLGGQVVGLTTITAEEGVVQGYRRCLAELESRFGIAHFGRRYLSSSAAGGLRIVVCGLTPNLTTKAALETALGAGGVILKTVSGAITPSKARDIEAINPNLVLLCGGLDDGEEDAVLDNARVLADLRIDSIVIYAGNQAIREEVRIAFTQAGKACVCTENVYPRVDEFRFELVQNIIREVFEKDVVKAKGLEAIQEDNGLAIPTPLAVSLAMEVLATVVGDLVAIDIGGATTDIHSIVTPNPMSRAIQATLEPRLKRTVEGDIGVFHNLKNLVAPDEEGELAISSPFDERLDLRKFAQRACRIALPRHAGTKVHAHNGQKPIDLIYGRDLSGVRTVVGTGGAIIHGFRDAGEFKEAFRDMPQGKLLPFPIDRALIDKRYVLSSIGLLAGDWPAQAARFLEAEFDERSPGSNLR